ncbi:MAG: hypothetical protein KJ749_06555 [Planctomycetes bacterium]|nr:hypothetical protein [Planctomycetota bacterium]
MDEHDHNVSVEPLALPSTAPCANQTEPTRCTHTAPTLVLGLGNILLRDEGVGVRVIESMRSLPLPAEVEVLDGGTAGFD